MVSSVHPRFFGGSLTREHSADAREDDLGVLVGHKSLHLGDDVDVLLLEPGEAHLGEDAAGDVGDVDGARDGPLLVVGLEAHVQKHRVALATGEAIFAAVRESSASARASSSSSHRHTSGHLGMPLPTPGTMPFGLVGNAHGNGASLAGARGTVEERRDGSVAARRAETTREGTADETRASVADGDASTKAERSDAAAGRARRGVTAVRAWEASARHELRAGGGAEPGPRRGSGEGDRATEHEPARDAGTETSGEMTMTPPHRTAPGAGREVSNSTARASSGRRRVP